MALLETYKPDELIADDKHTVATGTVTVASGEGVVKRGTQRIRRTVLFRTPVRAHGQRFKRRMEVGEDTRT